MIRPIALHGHTRSVTRVKFNREGDLLFSSAKDSSPTVWNAQTGERLGTYEGHNGAIWDIDVNFTSTLVATAGADQCAKLWDLKNGQCLATLPHETPVRVVAFSHGDSMLLTVTDTSFGCTPALHIYNLPGTSADAIRNARTEYRPMFSHKVPEKITFAHWGPTNETVYFSSEDGTIVILDIQQGKEIVFASPHKTEIKRFCMDKDYTTVLTASLDQTGRLLCARTLKTLKVYETDKPVNDAAIMPSQYPIIMLGGGQDAQSVTNSSQRANKFETRFFHKIFFEELGSVSGHFGPVNSITCSPDGKAWASGGEDGFVKLYHFDEEFHKNAAKLNAI
jgi:translation initiation factor 3 subunit I|uniref:Eukaryotic translation initiation factor 3 subunit I n=1 Tax=Eutreptiella gymnastica TaxID=73025 RepID=A0A7S4CT44_9EUGL